MALNPYTVEHINLSMVDPETGKNQVACVYHVDGIDRQLSISELVMVICMENATQLEAQIIKDMQEMNNTTALIEQLSILEEKIAEARAPLSSDTEEISTKITDLGLDPADYDGYTLWTNWLNDKGGVEADGADLASASTTISAEKVDEVVSGMETRLDDLNTFSQEAMIELQSETNKRDQAYDLMSSILKSFNTVLTGNANNI